MRIASSDGAGTLCPAPKNVKKKVAGLTAGKKPSVTGDTPEPRTAKKKATKSAAVDSKPPAPKPTLACETAKLLEANRHVPTTAQDNPSVPGHTPPPESVEPSVSGHTQHPDLQKLFAGEKNAEWFVIQSFGPAADALRLPGDGLVLWTGAGWRFMTLDRRNLPLTQDQAARRMLRYHLPAPIYRNLYPEESGRNDEYARVDTVYSEPEPPPLKLPSTGRITVSLTVESSDLVRWYCGVSHHRLEATVEGIVFRALESAKASYEDESGDDSFNIVLEDVLSAAQRGTDERAELLSDGRATFAQLDPLTERWLARHEHYRPRSRHNAINVAIIEKLQSMYETPLGDDRVPEGFPRRKDWQEFTAACDASWERRREAFGSRLALA